MDEAKSMGKNPFAPKVLPMSPIRSVAYVSGIDLDFVGRGERIRTSDLTVPNYRRCYFLPLLLSNTVTIRTATDKPFKGFNDSLTVLPIVTENVATFTESTHKSPHSIFALPIPLPP